MNQLSSISSSRARRYVLEVAAGVLAVAGVLLYFLEFDSTPGPLTTPEHALLMDRFSKATLLPADATIVVGDSSAGNAIDATLWSRLSGMPASNLALTGRFGIEGSLNMIRRSLAGKPGLVVIMQTPVMASQAMSLAGYVRSAPGLAETHHVSWAEWTRGAAAVVASALNARVLQQVVNFLRVGYQPHLEHDYVLQREQLTSEKLRQVVETRGEAGPVRNDFGKRISWIAEVCRSAALTCVYAYGPIYGPLCPLWRGYLAEIERTVRANGIAVIPGTPLCLSAEQVGDSYDHVAPEWKAWATQSYYERLARFLSERAQNQTP